MYFIQDEHTGNLIANLDLDDNQKIYFENMMSNYIHMLRGKYDQVEFTSKGISIPCGFAQENQEIANNLATIGNALKSVQKHEYPGLSEFDAQLLSLKLPDSSKDVSEVLSENHNMLCTEGSIYCTQSDYKNFIEEMDSTIATLKLERVKTIHNLKQKTSDYIDDINKVLKPYNCFSKFYYDNGKLHIYGVEVSSEATDVVNMFLDLKSLKKSLEEDKEENKEENKGELSTKFAKQVNLKSGDFVEKNYFVIRIRPNLIKFFIAPFYFQKLLKIIEGDIGTQIYEDRYVIAMGNFKIMKSTKKFSLSIKNDCSTKEMSDDSKFLTVAQNIKDELNKIINSKEDEKEETSKPEKIKNYWWYFKCGESNTEIAYDKPMNDITEDNYIKFKQGNCAATFTYSGSINNYNITFCNFEDNKGVQTNANTQKKRDIVRKEIWTTQTDNVKYDAKTIKIQPLKDIMNDYPESWRDIENLSYKTSKVNTVLLDLKSDEAISIRTMMAKSIPDVVIHQIERVQNLVAFHKYNNEK